VKYRANILEEQLVKGIRPCERNFGKEDSGTAAKLTLLQTDGSLSTVNHASPDSSYIGFYQQLGEAIRANREGNFQFAKVPVEPEDARIGIQIIEAAYESAKQRRVIDL
jgi:predicted dehydrogenase